MRNRSARVLCALLVGIAGASMTGAHQSSFADDPTPLPVTVVPEPTPLPSVAPTVAAEPSPTTLPTVQSEGPDPVATTIAPLPTPTTDVQLEDTPTPIVERTRPPTVVPTQASTPTPVPEVPTPVEAPWPSADQLRIDARLRWGTRVPIAVRRWAYLIVPAARKYHVDPNLVAAVMTMESNGDPLALSPANARGLMQVLDGPWDPKDNVFTGVRMLSASYQEFGDWSLALAAYNAGPGAVEAAGGIPPFRETRDYVIIVEYLWDLYGRHHLSTARRTAYRRSLGDLAHYKNQRKKVAKLARIGHIPDITAGHCSLGTCLGVTLPSVDVSPDAFWPVGGVPDPLQRIGPAAAVYSSPSGR